MEQVCRLLLSQLLLSLLLIPPATAQSTQKVSVLEDEGLFRKDDFLRSLFDPPVTETTIPIHQSRLVKGEAGVQAQVNADDFVHADGTPLQEPLLFRMTEVMDVGGLILGGLPTQSHGAMLESAGVVRLEAYSGGKPVELSPGKSVPIRFPEGYKRGMQLFEGSHSPSGDGNMDWEPMSTLSPANLRNPSFMHSFKESNLLYRVEPYLAEGEGQLRKFVFRSSKKSIREFIRCEVISKYSCIGSGDVDVRFRIGNDGRATAIEVSSSDNDCMALAVLETMARLKWAPSWRIKPYEEYLFSIQAPKNDPLRTGNFVSIADNGNTKMSRVTRESLRQLHAQRLKREAERQEEFYSRFPMAASKLGWINCDAFTNYRPVISMTIQNTTSKRLQHCYLVFDKMRAVMAGSCEWNGSIRFSNIPPGMPVHVVAFSKNLNEGPELAILPLVTKAGMAGTVLLEPVSEQTLKEKLAAL